MKAILLATGNPGKLEEIRAIFADLPYQVKSLADFDLRNDCIEDGETYLDNALKKANYYYDKLSEKLPVVADDSGLVVEALKGELGVYTRRWGAGEKVNDAEWLDFFMQKMRGQQNRRAAFVTFGVLKGRDQLFHFEGRVEGEITHEIEAEIKGGLPLSSVFRPDGYRKVFAAMTDAEKAAISHRGLAMSKIRHFLLENEIN